MLTMGGTGVAFRQGLRNLLKVCLTVGSERKGAMLLLVDSHGQARGTQSRLFVQNILINPTYKGYVHLDGGGIQR